jgi:hypothetical protein
VRWKNPKMREINGFGPWFGPACAKTKPLICIFGRLFFRPFFLRKKKGQEKFNKALGYLCVHIDKVQYCLRKTKDDELYSVGKPQNVSPEII